MARDEKAAKTAMEAAMATATSSVESRVRTPASNHRACVDRRAHFAHNQGRDIRSGGDGHADLARGIPALHRILYGHRAITGSAIIRKLRPYRQLSLQLPISQRSVRRLRRSSH